MLLPRRKQEADAAREARGRPAELFIPDLKLRLREQLREVMRFLHYSVRTEESYWLWIRRFILFQNKRHPQEMGSAEVHAFLTDLATHHGVAVATQNQALNALVFLYGQVLHQPLAQLANSLDISGRLGCQWF